VDVGDRLVDDLPRHRHPRIAAPSETLHLRDRSRALVEIVAVLRAHISPATVDRLGPPGKLHRLGEHLHELLPAALVLLLPEHLRQEEHREAVAVGVAVVGLGVADQAVDPRPADQVIDRLTDRLGIAALRGGRALHQHRRTRQRRHGGRITAFVGRPAAPPRLPTHEPVETLGHGPLHFLFARRRRHDWREQRHEHNSHGRGAKERKHRVDHRWGRAAVKRGVAWSGPSAASIPVPWRGRR